MKIFFIMLRKLYYTILFLISLAVATNAQVRSKDFSAIDEDSILYNTVLIKIKLSEETKDSNIKQSMQYAKEALATANKIGNERLIGESKLQLGKCYDFLGGNMEALNHLLEALEIFTRLNDRTKVAQTNKLIGYVYYLSDEYLSAYNYFENVYRFGIELRDTLLTIDGLLGKGSVYGNIQKMDSALIIFQEAFLLAQSIGNKANEVQSLFYIGDVNLYSGHPKKAIEIFHQIENDYNLAKVNPRMASGIYNSMTKAYIETKNFDAAKKYNDKAKEALKKIPRLDRLAYYHFLKFQIDTCEQNYRKAIKSYLGYKILNDSLRNSYFKEKIENAETLYELVRAEREVDNLTSENIIKDISLKQRRILNYSSILIITLLVVIVFQITRYASKTRLKNQRLQEQQEELAAINEELLSTNEELHHQREELEILLTNLKNTQQQLIQSEKMASLGVLSAGVAHEINNPLNFIKGGAVGIEEYLKTQCHEHIVELAPFIESINIGIERAVAIIQSLNHYSRQDDSKKTNCHIHSIIDNCLIMLHNKIKNRIIVEKNYSANHPYITGNEGKLHQAVLNILINAIQAIEDTGKIIISTRIVGKHLNLSFQDTGNGISKDNLTKIMDPFFTTKEAGQGVGLGLSIVQSIINDHKGTIEFESEEGTGTTVLITLPLSKGNANNG